MATSNSPLEPGRTLLRIIRPISVANLDLTAADTRISATDKSLIDERLNEVLRQRVKDVFSAAGDIVLRKIDSIKIDYQPAAGLGLADYLKQQILPQLEKEAGTRPFLLKLPLSSDEKISDILNLNTPLKKNPHFVDEIRVTRINEYAGLVGLKSDKLSKIAELDTDPTFFDMEHYEKLLADQIITPKEKKDLQLVFELGKLSDDNFSLVSSLKSTSVQSPRELAAWEQNDWVDFIRKEKIAVPQGESVEAYVENIMTNLSQTFPSYRLLSRIPKKLDEGFGQWNTITPLLKYNPKLLSSGADTEIDWKGITQRERERIEAGLGEIRGFMKGFRHLDVDKILADEATNVDAKQQLVQQKMQQLTGFIKNNGDIDLTTTDFLNKEEVRKMNWSNIQEADQKKIRNQMMAYQRSISLAGPEHAEKLVMKGFDSASDISDLQFEEFKIKSGLPVEMAKKTYSLANETVMATTHAFEAARIGLKDGLGNGLHVSNWDLPDYTNQLKELDGFDDLFGSQDYCNCEHCRSIFSPAAYFVDLMYFVEKNVSDKVFKTRKNHALYLKNRRPDLWSLELTCENTNTLIPYLDIVNEVLEAYLKRALSITDVYKRLQTEQISFNLPFNLYLEEIRIYLTHFSTTLFDIFKTLKNTNDEIWRERIKLNPEEWQVIITPDVSNNVRKRIGDPVAASFAKFDVKEFIRYAGITRSQLDDLMAIEFSKQLKPLVIIKEQSTDPLTDPLINYVEKITNLTNERLDFMHRFIRLWRKTGWTIREFDLLLTTLKENGLVNATANADKNGILDKEAIIQCAKLLELQEKMKLKTEEIPSLYGELTAKAVYDNKADFFTRTFNAQLLGSASSISFHHSFVNNDGVADPKLGFLLGGLGIAEGELVQLFGLLETVIVFDGSGNTTLNRENISLLYRHARIAKALKFTIEEFILALQLLFAGGNTWIDSTDKLFTLYTFKQKLQAIRLKITDCWFILKGEEKGAAGYKIFPDQSYSMVWNLQLQKTIYFDSALLADIIDVGADNSVKIIEEMVVEGLAVKKSLTEDLYRLTPAYLLTQNFGTVFTAITATAPVIAKVNDIRAKFNQFHAKNILQQNMAKLLNITTASFDNLLPFITIPLADNSMYIALYTGFDDKGVPLTAADLLPVVNLAKQFEKILYLFSKTSLKDEDILFVANNNSIFGIADPTLLSFDHIVNLAEYRKLVSINIEKRDKIQSLLQHYQSASVFSDEEYVLLSEFWKLDKNLLQSVATFIPLPATTMEAIAYLLECLALCKTLGINGESLNKLTETDFTKLEKIRDIIIGVFASKYPDEDERTKKMEPYHDKVNTKKRDALCDFIIAHNKELKFKDLHDLYAYFLLDVEMSGCFRTSRVVAAISSVQLYVFRCLMNLEQAAFATVVFDGNSDPDDDAFEFVKVAPALIPADEWEWRKNYRVWEANRKVFLYPENYILPELRDNKSPIFKDLEDELLQEKITELSAQKAYQKYLSQFAEMARLRVSGSYFDEASNTYYFFGKTNVDPPQYYYRTWQDQKTWTPWQKIEVAINSPYVSAIIYVGKLYIFWTEIKVKEETSVSGGSSASDGFSHTVSMLCSSLDENGKWMSPQRFYFSDRKMASDYTVGEVMNRKIFPGIKDKKLYLFYSDYDYTASLASNKRFDLYNNKLVGSDFLIIPFDMDMPTGTDLLNLDGGSTVALIPVKGTYNRHEARADDELIVASSSVPPITSWIDNDIYHPELGIVGRKYGDFIFKTGNQQFLIQKRGEGSDYLYGGMYTGVGQTIYRSKWRMIRISTSLADKLGEKLFLEGIEEFLKLETQKFKEDLAPFSILDTSYLSAPYSDPNHVDFISSYGQYYWEIFFHIPFLIASHLNADQKFEESDWWYRQIFDPTSADVTVPEKDRNWKFIVFRGLSIPKLQEILTNSAAIEAYKKDPFNPHAIARLRLSAYQKTIVMKYIDNLLDWGDYLFAQDTMESINEATMLYIMAYDILGKRPVKLGDCETAGDPSLTYEKLGPAIGKGSEFLIQLENYTIVSAVASSKTQASKAFALNDIIKATIKDKMVSTPSYSFDESVFTNDRVSVANKSASSTMDKGRAEYTGVQPYDRVKTEKEKQGSPTVKKTVDDRAVSKRPPHREVVQQKILAFCIPNNEELLKYWDRVEDRLFKIRNCMNISGVRRSLALFQPPIDPMMLVKAKAAGLSLEEILASLHKPLPCYRFTFLLEKARLFAQTVQSFGNGLLGAMEKKDIEELTLIRSVNEKEILDLTTQVKTNAIAEAQNQFLALQEQEALVQLKIEHYAQLIENDLTGWEVTQQVARHIATGFKISESVVHLMAAITYLIPEVGSPFAMKYGGKQLGHSGVQFAQWTTAMASVAEAISTSAALEATFQRREEEWNHSLSATQQEIKVVQKQKLAADFRAQIMARDLEIHEKNIEHNEEIENFHKNKFTNLGLYNYLATTLTRLYREAYNTAYDLAKLAEQAYQFERDDDTIFIAPDNWQFDKAGLLSGEKLLMQLQRLEKTYIENNRRDYEVTQSISMAVWAPEKLTELRQKGSCTFEIPELAYDIYYPGQYRRMIKSVKLSIPSIAGPFTNISCKLSLVDSKMRKEPSVDADVISVPVQKLTSIATSNAQNDSGVFELNFRDERYLPFEGAGAISTWRLEMPNKIRTFDYGTIADVIFQVSYTAKDDGAYREAVEANIATAVEDFASANGLFRMFSLKHEFPDVFHRLLFSTTNPQTAEFELLQQHFPYMFAGKDLALTNAKIFLKPVSGETITTSGLTVKLNAFSISSWSDFPSDGSVSGDLLLKEGSASVNGTPLKKWKIDAGNNGIKKEEVDDIIIVMKYSVS